METDSSGASMMKGMTQSPAIRKINALQLRVRVETLCQHDRDSASLVDSSTTVAPGQKDGWPAPPNQY